METILALDCGTQSVRAMLFDFKGNLIHKLAILNLERNSCIDKIDSTFSKLITDSHNTK